jgi:aryl-alcohol dehydrogenase-like predicted oxidoreductase
MREVERSLRRLGTDHIDVYLLHSFDLETPLEETLRALDDLVAQGKVLYVGCCNFAAWQVVKALWTQDGINVDPFICIQNQYSLLHRTLEDEMFGLVRDWGLGVMAYGPLAIGLLSGSYTPGEAPPPGSVWAANERDVFESATSGYAAVVLDTVCAMARERSKTMAQVALNWVLSHPEITVAISGSDTIEQLDDNLGAVGWELSEEEMARLTEVSSGGHVDLMRV